MAAFLFVALSALPPPTGGEGRVRGVQPTDHLIDGRAIDAKPQHYLWKHRALWTPAHAKPSPPEGEREFSSLYSISRTNVATNSAAGIERASGAACPAHCAP